MGVSAIVVTYNRLNLLKECLSNLLNQSYKLDHIFVINNNSSDGTKGYLNNLHNKRIISKTLTKNLGGAGGFSLGTKLAYENSNSDYFWIMDDDTMPTKESLKNLIIKAKLLKNKFGFLCSNVRWWKNNAPCNIPQVANDWTQLIDDSLVKVKTSTFVSVLVPRIRVKELGLPIGDMFIWGDDTEYTTRLSRKYPSYFVPQSIVLHKSSSNRTTDNIFNTSVNRIKFYNCMYRNIIYICRKYYPTRRVIRALLGFVLAACKMPFESHNYRLKKIDCILSGVIKGIVFNPHIKYPNRN